MRRKFHFNLIHIVFFFFILLFISLFNKANAALNNVEKNEQKFELITKCATEESALTRLECYDKVLRPNLVDLSDENAQQQHSTIWNWIVDQEKQRSESNIDFIMNTFNDGQRVLLTTPALGHQPPRPILAISCVDNITRMQIILFNPMDYSNNKLQLVSNNNEVINANWFVREDGFIFESSRGLFGIEQIKGILHAKSITLKSDEPMLNGLVFNLTGLETTIKTLRTACHW